MKASANTETAVFPSKLLRINLQKVGIPTKQLVPRFFLDSYDIVPLHTTPQLIALKGGSEPLTEQPPSAKMEPFRVWGNHQRSEVRSLLNLEQSLAQSPYSPETVSFVNFNASKRASVVDCVGCRV